MFRSSPLSLPHHAHVWEILKNLRFFLSLFFFHSFSDPCLAANSEEDETQPDRDKSNMKNQSDHNKLIATLIKQINILHETNSKICRNLNDTKSEYCYYIDVLCAVRCFLLYFAGRCIYTCRLYFIWAHAHGTNRLKFIWLNAVWWMSVCLCFFHVFSFGNKKCDWKEVKFHMRYEISFQLKKKHVVSVVTFFNIQKRTHSQVYKVVYVCADWICRNDMKRWWMATTKILGRLLWNARELFEMNRLCMYNIF